MEVINWPFNSGVNNHTSTLFHFQITTSAQTAHWNKLLTTWIKIMQHYLLLTMVSSKSLSRFWFWLFTIGFQIFLFSDDIQINGLVTISKNNVYKELENWGNFYIKFSIKRTTKPNDERWTNILHISTGMYLFLRSKIQSCQK